VSREDDISTFLAQAGFGGTRATPLAEDASFRRYLRLAGGPRPAVLMDAPPPEDVRSFLRVGEHLARLGVSVPEVIAADTGRGLLLLEDLGDALFPEAAREVGQEPLLDAAVDALLTMQSAPAPAFLPHWDAQAMAETALGTLLDWWWPATFGEAAPEAARNDFARALTAMLSVLGGPEVFVHRDFFAGNLLWLKERRGIRRVGVLDFQSAAIGHPAYDLAALTQDARREVSPALGERAVARFLAARPGLDPERFRACFAVCAAQRHMRVAGQWVRLARRDGKPGYLAHGPRTWQLLAAALRHPATTPLKAAFDQWIPMERRGNPRMAA
jgi:N-acetylmuramate 1-kinase